MIRNPARKSDAGFFGSGRNGITPFRGDHGAEHLHQNQVENNLRFLCYLLFKKPDALCEYSFELLI